MERAVIIWSIRWIDVTGNTSVQAEVIVVGEQIVSFSSQESKSIVAVSDGDLDLFHSAF